MSLLAAASSPIDAARGWEGVWTYDSCHQDRKAGHDKEGYCREGKDRIIVASDALGRYDITLCPSDAWGEHDVSVDAAGRRLRFKTRDGLDVRLVLGEGDSRFNGLFRSSDGHAGRVWGRRVAGCR